MEIKVKFRGKDKTGIWRFGDFTHSQGIGEDGKLHPRILIGGYEVNNRTIGRMLAESIPNNYELWEGFEIYNGDIVKFLDFSDSYFSKEKSEFEMCCSKKESLVNVCGDIYLGNGKKVQVGASPHIEILNVLGNIFDNPELTDYEYGEHEWR